MNFERLEDLQEILEARKGNKIRYRREGIESFTNDILVSYTINGFEIDIIMEKETVKNYNVDNISYTYQEDNRIDIWIYGSMVNRFNIC